MRALLVTTACCAWTPHTLSVPSMTPTCWRQPMIVASGSPGEWWRRAARRGGRNERPGQAAAGPQRAPSAPSSDERISGGQRRVFVPWLLNSYTGELVELAVTLILALSPLWVGFFASQLISAYAIPSRSMDETLKVGDVVLAEKVSSMLHLPLERGDLIFSRRNCPRLCPRAACAWAHAIGSSSAWRRSRAIGYSSTRQVAPSSSMACRARRRRSRVPPSRHRPSR